MDDPTPEQQAVAILSAYLERLLLDYADELNESEDKRRAFFAFVFGGIGGLAIREGLSPPQAHAVAMGVFCETLEISPMDSIRMAQLGIDAAAGDSTWSYASHEGLDEFFDWQADPAAFQPSRLRLVLDRAPAKST
ncbi:MAG: Imm48 family immunity protein [Isosphaerales bacterium]